MRRTERLFAIAEYLRGRRTGVTAEVLAERFGVTMRTMYRDLSSLREASLPIASERGRGGGYALERTYSLPPVNFTAREAALLVAACNHAIAMRTLPFVDTLSSALDKVRGALSTSSQRVLMQLVETLHFVGIPALTTKPEVRKVIERAWFERQPIEIGYWARDGRVDGLVAQRRVEIRSVVMERTETLLNCFDLDKNEMRQFRLDRIVEARLLRPRA